MHRDTKTVSKTKNYTQNNLLDRVDLLCHDHVSAKIPLDLKIVDSHPDKLSEFILYRKGQQEEEYKKTGKLSPRGFCFGLIFMVWLSSKKPEEFFNAIRLIFDYELTKLKRDSESINLIAKIELIQWAQYHTEYNQYQIEKLLSTILNIDVIQTSFVRNKSFTCSTFLTKLISLKDNELMVVSSVPPHPFTHNKHAIGIIHRESQYYFFESNESICYEKVFRFAELYKIFIALFKSFYTSFHIPIPNDLVISLPLDIHTYQFSKLKLNIKIEPLTPTYVLTSKKKEITRSTAVSESKEFKDESRKRSFTQFSPSYSPATKKIRCSFSCCLFGRKLTQYFIDTLVNKQKRFLTPRANL